MSPTPGSRETLQMAAKITFPQQGREDFLSNNDLIRPLVPFTQTYIFLLLGENCVNIHDHLFVSTSN